MSGFEYLFTFYGLLLGIAVANVATGFADMWRGHAEVRPGTLIPLLGGFLLIAASHQWVSFWGGREVLTMGPGTLLICIGVALPYIFASQAMRPRNEAEWKSLDEYYLAHRRILLTSVMLPPVVSLIFNFAMGSLTLNVLDASTDTIRIGAPLALMFTDRRWLHHLGLILLCATLLVLMFVTSP